MKHDFPDQPNLSYTLKDKEALKAAEEHCINTYTSYTRNVTDQWAFDDADLSKLRFNDSAPGKKDGYLICAIKESIIHSHEDTPDEVWIIEVMPDIGMEVEAEVYQVYQGINGEWIVETA